ncbi:hypothetical protein LCGC14_1002120 [marine sediment metagenome]|uniref:Uncharacterized protein n=1 Tax=marine sediment metagenome TaxID=412755 RepID=A0A0F9QL83_9ZZZZ
MQVSADQLFNQIGRLQVEKSSLEQSNVVLAQEVLKLRERLSNYEGQGKAAKPENVTEFPEPKKPE